MVFSVGHWLKELCSGKNRTNGQKKLKSSFKKTHSSPDIHGLNQDIQHFVVSNPHLCHVKLLSDAAQSFDAQQHSRSFSWLTEVTDVQMFCSSPTTPPPHPPAVSPIHLNGVSGGNKRRAVGQHGGTFSKLFHPPVLKQ